VNCFFFPLLDSNLILRKKKKEKKTKVVDKKELPNSQEEESQEKLSFFQKLNNCLRSYQKGEYKKSLKSLSKLEEEFIVIENFLNTVTEENYSLLRTRGQLWSLLGASYEKMGNYEKSTLYYNKALTNCLYIEDRLGEAVIYNNLARIWEKQKKYGVAKEFYMDSLKILTEVEDKKIKCGSLYNLAEMCRKLGGYDESSKYFNESFKIFSELNDEDSKGKVLYKIGKICRLKKNYKDSLNYQLQSMNILKVEDFRNDEKILSYEPVLQVLGIKTRRELGLVFFLRGEIKLSLKYFGDALRIAFKSVGRGARTGKILMEVAKVYEYIRKFLLALKYFNFSLDDFRKVKDEDEISNVLNYIGEVYRSMKNYPFALEYFNKTLVIKKKIGSRVGKRDVHLSRVLINIGLIYRLQKEYEKSLEYFFNSLEVLQKSGDKNGESATLNNIGIIYDSKKEYTKALEYFEKSLELCKIFNNRNGLATTINNIGSIYTSMGDMDKSLKLYVQAFKIFGEINNKFREATTGYNLAFFHYSFGELEKSIYFLKHSLKLFKTMKCEVEVLESTNFLQVVKTKIERKRQKLIWGLLSKEKIMCFNDFIILNQIEKKRSGGDKYSCKEGDVYKVQMKNNDDFPKTCGIPDAMFTLKVIKALGELDYSKTSIGKEKLFPADDTFHPHILMPYGHFKEKINIKDFQGLSDTVEKEILASVGRLKTANFSVYPLCCCNLKEKLEKIEMNEITFLSYTKQILDGLSFIFSLGIAHRDLTEENIFVSFEGNLLIGGFGNIFRAKKNKNSEFVWTSKKKYHGNSGYVAPEIKKNCVVDYSMCDIYSLGVIFDNMYKQILTKESKKNGVVSKNIKKIIMKMRDPNPEKRIGINSLLTKFTNLLEIKICTKKN